LRVAAAGNYKTELAKVAIIVTLFAASILHVLIACSSKGGDSDLGASIQPALDASTLRVLLDSRWLCLGGVQDPNYNEDGLLSF
jgi:hypothetical protein